MLSTYVYGIQPPLALKGELFEALPSDEQPTGVEDKLAVRGLKQKCLQVECPKEDLAEVSDKDAYILLAVQSYTERCKMVTAKRSLLSWGVTDNEGCQVSVWIDDLRKDVAAVLHYKGALPPYDGIMFGVEIVDPCFCNRGTTDGVFRCQRYFSCAPRAGLFVSLDKMSVPLDDDTDATIKTEESIQDDYTHILKEGKTELGEDSGMESSGHSVVEADVLEEKSNTLVLNENVTETLQLNGSDRELCCERDLKERNVSEERTIDFEQWYLKEKNLLLERQCHLKESKSRISCLQMHLGEEVAARENLEEKYNALQKELSALKLHRSEMEVQLKDEKNKVRKMQKCFEREWEEFEKRLIEEHAAKSNIEQELRNSLQQLEKERNSKTELQKDFQALQQRLRQQNEDFKEQTEQKMSSFLCEMDGTSTLPELESHDWLVHRDEIEIAEERRLGTGGWGVVKEGKFRGSKVAVKQIHELILSPHNRRLFIREMSISSRCRHPCLLQFIGATSDDGIPLFVTELMDISLRELLEKQCLTNVDIVTIALDVTRALNYLHLNKPPIIHRDVSSANVLLWRRDNKWRAKVSDYGTANFMRQCRTINPGAVIYSAPEALSLQQSPKIDVYSFGLLLCEMCIRELPVPHQIEDQISMVTDQTLKNLVISCIRKDPKERPSMAEVICELEQMESGSLQ